MTTPEIIRSKTRKAGPLRKVHEFGLEFYRGDEPVTQFFKAYPSMDAGSLNYTLSSSHRPERAVEGMVRSIKKMLADDDGTPAGYKPRQYEPPAQEVDDAEPEEFGEVQQNPDLDEVQPLRQVIDAMAAVEVEEDELDADMLYVGPDGKPHTAEEINKALEFEAGSSRRRFTHLMDVDESLTLEVDQLQKLYQTLVGKAANRPTRR